MKNILSNMPIKNKLSFSFVAMIIMFCAVMLFSHVTFRRASELYIYGIDIVVARSNDLAYIQQQFLHHRLNVNTTIFNDQWRSAISEEGFEAHIYFLGYYHNYIMQLVRCYMTCLQDDMIISEYARATSLHLMQMVLDNLYTSYALFNDYFSLHIPDTHLLLATQLAEVTENNLSLLRQFTNSALDDIIDDVNANLRLTTSIGIYASIAIVLLLSAIAFLSLSTFSKLINNFKNKITIIAQGDIHDIEVLSENIQEIGEFSELIKPLSQNLHALISNINAISDQQLAHIETDNFTGIYKDIAISINTLLNTITEEKEENEFKQLVIDTVPVLISLWDKDCGLQVVNKEAVRRYSLLSEEEYLQNFGAFSPEFQPDGSRSSDKALEYLRESLINGYSHFRWMHHTSAGELIPSFITCHRVQYHGETAILTFNTDLRKLEASQAAEKIALDRISFLFNSAPLFIEYWNTDLELVEINDLTLKFWGFNSLEEYTGNHYDLLTEKTETGDNSKDYWNKKLRDTFRAGKESWEYSCIDPDGNIMYLKADAFLMTLDNKQVVVTYSHDITELKLSIENATIEKQKADTALENSHAKSNFLAKMSHEIRTPISIVLGISEIQLQRTRHNPDTQEAFAKVYSSARTLLSIVNDILDISKIESGKMTLAPRIYDVSSFIGDSIHLNAVYRDGKEIDFRIYVNPHLPMQLIGDELRIKQILNNILSNAFKYTEKGYVSLSVDYEEIDKDNLNLLINVNDTGNGMDASQLETLFESYVRFHNDETKYVQGTGLGMSITKQLLTIMNGTINVRSIPSVGTKVTISIPQVIHEHQKLGHKVVGNLQNFKANTESIANKLNIAIEPMPYGSVLVVDDTDANIYVAKGLLDRYELKVDTASSGLEAINKIKNGAIYDLIFMDQMMPQIGGNEATSIIRNLGYTHAIVSFTANAIVGQAEEALTLGYDGFLSKPLEPHELNDMLIKHVKTKHLGVGTGITVAEVEPVASAPVNDPVAPPPTPAQSTPAEPVPPAPLKGLSYLEDPAIVKMVQEDFIKEQSDVYEKIIDAIASSDLGMAKILVHTLKSFGNMLNEPKLHSLATQLEKIFASGDIPEQSTLEELREEIKLIISKM